MLTRYKDYTFYMPDSGADVLQIRCGWPGVVISIPVRESDSYRVKINKKSVSAHGGALGLFVFLSDCIRNDFMMVYVRAILRTFCKGV